LRVTRRHGYRRALAGPEAGQIYRLGKVASLARRLSTHRRPNKTDVARLQAAVAALSGSQELAHVLRHFR
jgi:hypothetical protein